MSNSEKAQAAVDAFNRDNQVGAFVEYWTGDRNGRGKFTTTRHTAELLGGHTPVVWVTGNGSCIALTHVRPVPHQPDGIDEQDDSGALPAGLRAAERINAYVSEFGDGLYDVVGGAPLYGRDLAAVARVITRADGWLIWSRYHEAWWKPNEAGYTGDMMCAGRYHREDADRIARVRTMNDGSPGEVVVKAPELELIGVPNLMEKMRGRISAATRVANKARQAAEAVTAQ
jgi:hypothetical protein